jgi:hypothetical protein
MDKLMHFACDLVWHESIMSLLMRLLTLGEVRRAGHDGMACWVIQSSKLS